MQGLLWNQCMLRDALPKGVDVHMVKEAIKTHAAGGAMNVPRHCAGLLPDCVFKIERRWESIVSLIYARPADRAISSTTPHPRSQSGSTSRPPSSTLLDRTDEATPVIVQVRLMTDLMFYCISMKYIPLITSLHAKTSFIGCCFKDAY